MVSFHFDRALLNQLSLKQDIVYLVALYYNFIMATYPVVCHAILI